MHLELLNRDPEQRRGVTPRLAWLLLASGLIYLAPALILNWNAWGGSPTNQALCGCGDPAMFTWFLGWPAHALSHGMNPLHASSVLVPEGLNLMSATSILGLGLPLSPVTWIWGPAATLNVTLSLIPWLTALSTTAFLVRFLRHRWLAVPFAGLVAFSPFVVSAMRVGHLNVGAIFLLPLIGISVDELLRTRRYPPVRVGIALGVLLAGEVLVSTEQLMFTAVVLSVLGLGGLVALRGEGRRHLALGLLAAGGSAALFAGPLVAYALLGPQHLSGVVWAEVPYNGLRWRDIAGTVDNVQGGSWSMWTGALSPTMVSPGDVGWVTGILAVLGLALRRSCSALVAAAVGVVAMFLALSGLEWGGVWIHLYRMPLLSSALQGRLIAYTLIAAVLLVAMLADELMGLGARIGRAGRGVGLVAAAGVLLLAALPVAGSAKDMPLTLTKLGEPAWFATHGEHLKGEVVLPVPTGFSIIGDALSWQARDGYGWSQPGFEGPQGLLRRFGAQRHAADVLERISAGFTGEPPAPSSKNLVAVRQALRYWGVRYVVVPTDVSWPSTKLVRTPNYAVAFLTAALGTRPQVDAKALVWDLKAGGWGHRVPGAERSARECWKAPQTLQAAYEVSRCVIDRGGASRP